MPCWDKYWLTYFVALLGAVRYICSAVGWLGGSLISYFVGWLVSWLAGLLVGWLAGWLVRWIVAWLVGWLAGWLTKKCLRIPQISYGFKETFHFLILILARRAAYLITQLTRFLELRGSLFFRHRHPRYAGHFFSTLRSSWNPKTQPDGSRAATWLSFWCSTWPLVDTVAYYDLENNKRKIKKKNYMVLNFQFFFFAWLKWREKLKFLISFDEELLAKFWVHFRRFHFFHLFAAEIFFLHSKLFRLKFGCQNT